MKKYVKQVKKGLAALTAAVFVLGSGAAAPATAYANEMAGKKVVRVVGVLNTGIVPQQYEMAITEDGGLWAWGNNEDGVQEHSQSKGTEVFGLGGIIATAN